MLLPILHSLLTLVLVLAAFGFMSVRLFRLGILINTGVRGDESLTGRPAERIGKVLQMIFGHRKVLEDPWAGSLHLFFLYGFLFLGIGHVEVVLEGLTRFLAAFGRSPLLYERLPFFPAVLVAPYHFSQDLMALLVLLASVIALGRRFSGKVSRLIPRSADAERILYFIVALYLTFFLLTGSTLLRRMQAAGDFTPVAYQPVSSLVAGALAGFSAAATAKVRYGAWWAHVVVFLGFAVYIPMTKHMHLVFAWPNVFFFRQKRYGLPPKLDLEAAEKFGIDRVQELPWKSLLDTFACTECGRCNSVCPAHATGKPLQPMKVLYDVKVNLRHANGPELLKRRDRWGRPRPEAAAEEAWQPSLALVNREPIERGQPGRVRADGAYLGREGQVHADEIWACTTCAACVEVCPVLIDSVPGTLVGLRQSLVMMESEFPSEATSAFKGMEVKGNPWGAGQDRRTEWAESMGVPVMAEIKERKPEREVQYLFWVGCAGATDPRARKTQQALVKVLKAAKVDFAILGREEKCTGDPARRLGNEYVFAQLAQENVATLSKYKFKKVFTTCPHCFNSLKNEYGEFGGSYTVQHHSELLAELLRDKRIPLDTKRVLEEHVTFHDPCYLSRYNQGAEPPREVLLQIGVRTTEMAKSRQASFCCGAGGGRIFLEEKIGTRVNVERTEQALATGAQTVVVGCPFCMTMLTDGTKAKNVEDSLKVKDLAELVAERLAAGAADPRLE